MIESKTAKQQGSENPTFVCLAGYDKGQQFLVEAGRLGCRVFLITAESLRERVEWPREHLAEIYYIPQGSDGSWNIRDLINTAAHIARYHRIDRIIGLDDFDQENAALLREHFRMPGLGESATRYFRDKLAMRTGAGAAGIRIPAFTGTSHYADITSLVDSIPPPWILKPRFLAGAIGIRKCETREQAWEYVHRLGDNQSFFVLEQFVPGDVFHVDSIWWGGRMVGAVASGYGRPPFEVAHSGGIFTTALLERGTELDGKLCRLNERVLQAFGMQDGVSHSEFIQPYDGGKLLFLETSCRVGGAFIADLIETGLGFNLWAEWARVEAARARKEIYTPPQLHNQYAGLLVSLARQEWPDTSGFDDPEVAQRIHKRHHVALVLRSPSHARIQELLGRYAGRVQGDFHASAPAPERPTF